MVRLSPGGRHGAVFNGFAHAGTGGLIAALRLEGLGAPAVFDGPIDRPSVLAMWNRCWSSLTFAPHIGVSPECERGTGCFESRLSTTGRRRRPRRET
jgi:hypothetical protein